MTEVDFLLKRKNFNVEVKEHFCKGITGIFGPSGSGKTSLLHTIAGLEKPKEGKISINGRVLFDKNEGVNIPVEKRNIGYVFQEGRLFPHMTVEKNLLYGNKRFGSKKISFEKVVEMLNLKHLLNSKPSQISGGERQRTALGRTLLSSPDILLLDEPFSALDAKIRNQIIPFILRIQEKVKIPIMVVSHDLTDLLKLTNKLFLIKNGQCVGHDKYYKLLKDQNALEIFGSAPLVNSITMNVLETNPETGLTLLGWKESSPEVIISCEKSRNGYKPGEEIKIFVDAADIAISLEKSSTITIQNQVQGTITDIIKRGSTLLCIVDAGFRLVVEVTSESQNRLGIRQGSKIWCMFKSVSIDVAG